MAFSKRCLLAVQGVAVVLLTLFVLVFIVLVVVLRVSLENCDSNCSEATVTDGNDAAAGGEGACSGACSGLFVPWRCWLSAALDSVVPVFFQDFPLHE